MRRTVAFLGVLAVLLFLVGFNGLATAQSGNSSESPVRIARASWDTGWFQTEVYRLLIQYLGYQVDDAITMGIQDFYEAVADGEMDLWANGWFPTHNSHMDAERSEAVGFQVHQGALQGYFIDKATAEEYDITNLGDLSNPTIAALFDTDDDGRANLLGCQEDWGCAEIIDDHLEEYGLTDTVEHIQGQYSPQIRDLIDNQYRAGDPVLYYTWTPNWTGGELVPGQDVVWLETPLPSFPPDQSSSQDSTALSGLEGCANDPCQVGWPPNDIRAVANTAFLEAHPAGGHLRPECPDGDGRRGSPGHYSARPGVGGRQLENGVRLVGNRRSQRYRQCGFNRKRRPFFRRCSTGDGSPVAALRDLPRWRLRRLRGDFDP